jgi:hypothetical protein
MHRTYSHRAGKWLWPFLAVLALAVLPAVADAATTPATSCTVVAPAVASNPCYTVAPAMKSPPPPTPQDEVTNPQVGRTILGDKGTWTGASTYNYQWLDCVDSAETTCTPAGAPSTNTTYKIAQGDVGKFLALQVTANGSGSSTTANSAPSGAAVKNGTPLNRTAPAVTGLTQDGKTLTASPGTWDGTAPITYTYQWRRCDTAGKNCGASVTGAPSTSNTYTLTDPDLNHTMSVVVTATNPATAPTTPAVPAVTQGSFATATVVTPGNTAAPTISGTPQQGNTLTAAHGSWVPGSSTLADQWASCDASGAGCTAVPGATAPTYKLTASDVGHTIVVQETAASSGATSSPVASSATGVVQAPPTPIGNPGGGSGGNPGGSGGNPGGSGGNPGVVKPVQIPVKAPVIVKPTVQLRGLLTNILAVHGGGARIRALLKRGGYAFTFSAPFAGRLVISWYRVQRHHHRMLVATVSVRLRKSGKARIALKLSRDGRKLLKAEHRLALAAQDGFTPVGQGTTSASRTITLIR